jgi:hypothetical protein
MPFAPSSGIDLLVNASKRAPAFLIPSGRCHLRALVLRRSSVLRSDNSLTRNIEASFQSFNRLFAPTGQRRNGQSTGNGCNRPSHPNPSAGEPPGYYRLCRSPRSTEIMSNFPWPSASHCFSAQTSRLRKKRHNLVLSCRPADLQWAPQLRGSGGTPSSTFEAALSFILASPSF